MLVNLLRSFLRRKYEMRGREEKGEGGGRQIQTARKKGRKEGRKEGKEGREGSGSYQILKLETITRRNLYAKLELGKCKSFAI